jgi:hypothetical protein
MAKVIGPLLSNEASGKIGERLTFSVRAGGQQVRFQKAQTNVSNFKQLRNQEIYKDAVAAWNFLSPAEKAVWKTLASGQFLTGYNLFVQDYYMGTIRKLATITGVDLKIVAKTLLYTVPTGFKLLPIGFALRFTARDTPIGDGGVVLVRGSDDAEVSLDPNVTDFMNMTLDGIYLSISTGLWRYTVPAGDTVQFSVWSPDTAITLIADVDLLGYLMAV